MLSVWWSLLQSGKHDIAINMPFRNHYSDVTWKARCPKSPADWLFVQQLAQANPKHNNKETTRLCITGPLSGEPPVIGSNAEMFQCRDVRHYCGNGTGRKF